MSSHLALDASPATLWGFYDGTDWQQSLNGLAAYDALDKLIGKPMSITGPQLSWAWGLNADGSPKYRRLHVPRLAADRARGRLPVMTWISFNGGLRTDPAQTILFNNESILAGKHDAYINQFALDAAAYGHKFVVRFDPEFNGWWEGPFSEYDSAGKLANGNTDGSFARMWRHVVDIVRPIAPNVSWYWCANPLSASGPTSAAKLPHFYPGDAHADFVGYDVYNKASAANSPWLTFQECLEGKSGGWPVNSMAPMLALAPGKPWILGEVGCASATAGDATPGAGDRAAWIAQMHAVIRARYPFIVAYQWFNVAPYAIDAAAAAGFTTGTAGSSFPGAPLLDPESFAYRVVDTPDLDVWISTANANLIAAQQQTVSLRQQVDAGQQQLVSAQTQLASLQSQVISLQSQLASARSGGAADLAALRQQIADGQAQLANVQVQLDASNADDADAHARLTAAANGLSELFGALRYSLTSN